MRYFRRVEAPSEPLRLHGLRFRLSATRQRLAASSQRGAAPSICRKAINASGICQDKYRDCRQKFHQNETSILLSQFEGCQAQ